MFVSACDTRKEPGRAHHSDAPTEKGGWHVQLGVVGSGSAVCFGMSELFVHAVWDIVPSVPGS
jgi:hypothetical protein